MNVYPNKRFAKPYIVYENCYGLFSQNSDRNV